MNVVVSDVSELMAIQYVLQYEGCFGNLLENTKDFDGLVFSILIIGHKKFLISPSTSPIPRRRQSLSIDSGPSYKRSLSPERGSRWPRRGRAMSYSLSPHNSIPSNPQSPALAELRRQHVVKAEEIPIAGVLDRRTRRQRQAEREEDIAKRQHDGRKPFYLTLDSEGKPYGLGKPAWVAEIGKLAMALDPSCTHIARQTYDDVTTFKARLDERFEYSGTLNEDHLRSMMGKAVTKKRGELFKLIRKGGSQPFHIDHEVWERLVKLEASKQREAKSEQGRYANACRRTYGRTGSRGINGVRERLRDILGRSPDPDEMEREIKRDKGYGGYKRKRRENAMEQDNRSKQELSEDNSMTSQSTKAVSEGGETGDKLGSPENLLSSADKVGSAQLML